MERSRISVARIVFFLHRALLPSGGVNYPSFSEALARTLTQTWTWGLPRKYQTMEGPSICQTSQTPSLPISWFL